MLVPLVNAAAHPHVRGEDAADGSTRPTSIGSPPRAWGGLEGVQPGGLDYRLTPTCVGRTLGEHADGRWAKAHPHVRGEDEGDPE